MLRVIDDIALDLIPALREAILARSLVEPPFRSMNVGGWRSDESFFSWDLGVVHELRARLAPLLEPGSLVGWAVVNQNDSYHKRHNHLGRQSGVLYVDPGDAPSSPTIFEIGLDAEGAVAGEQRVEPAAGRLALFPSSMMHWVPAYAGPAVLPGAPGQHGHRVRVPRITIGFDVR